MRVGVSQATPALRFELGCPDCGGRLEPLAGGKPTDRMVSMILRCVDCAADSQVVVVLDVIHRPKFRAPNGCGIRAKQGYSRAKKVDT